MVNMKLILLVSLAVVFVESVPVQEHRLVKRGLFDNFMENARNHLSNAGTALQQHLQTARERIQSASDQLRTHHENVRDHMNNLGERMGEHLETVKDHFSNLADDLDFGSIPDSEEDESEPVIDLS